MQKMQKNERFNIQEGSDSEKKHPFWGSVRMTYTICSFLSILSHHCMRNSISITVLCMAPIEPQNSTSQSPTVQKNELNWTRQDAIVFQSVFFYGYIVTLPIAGYISDRYGGKAPFVWSQILESICFILIPVCVRTNFYLTNAIRILQGLIASFSVPALYQLFSKWGPPSERTSMLIFAYFGFNIANLFIYPVSVYFCNFGWQSIFYFLGVIGLIFGIVFQWLVFSSIDDHPRISPQEYKYLQIFQQNVIKFGTTPWKKILKCIPIYAFIITHFCHTLNMTIEILLLPRYLKEAMKFEMTNIGFLTSLIYSGSLISKLYTVTSSILLDKRKNFHLDIYRRLLHFTCCTLAVLFTSVIMCLTSSQRYIVLVCWFLMHLFTDIAFSGAYWPSILFLAPSYSGVIIGIANCIALSSAYLVPVLMKYLIPVGSESEWSKIIGVLAIVYAIDALVFSIFGRSVLQPWGIKEDDENKITDDTSKSKK